MRLMIVVNISSPDVDHRLVDPEEVAEGVLDLEFYGNDYQGEIAACCWLVNTGTDAEDDEQDRMVLGLIHETQRLDR